MKAVNQNHQVWFHRLGTPQAEDRLVYRRPDQPEWYLHAEVSDDGRWLVIRATRGTHPESALFVQDLSAPGATPVPLVDRMDAAYEFVDSRDDTFLLLTDESAPRRRLVAVRLGKAEPKDWTEVIPESKGGDVLRQVSVAGDRLVALWTADAKSVVELRDLSGRSVAGVPLPGIGTASGFAGKRGDPETFFVFTGFTTPPTIFRLDTASGAAAPLRSPRVDFDPSRYETRQVFYPCKDGTRDPHVPRPPQGARARRHPPDPPLRLRRLQHQPHCPPSPSRRVAWLEMGGVYAVANMRGGGEYGKKWYDGGRLANKQNVFDDFIAAAEWLIEQKYTSPPEARHERRDRTAGCSSGAVMTQRPTSSPWPCRRWG